jgi:hypothetical protein
MSWHFLDSGLLSCACVPLALKQKEKKQESKVRQKNLLHETQTKRDTKSEAGVKTQERMWWKKREGQRREGVAYA